MTGNLFLSIGTDSFMSMGCIYLSGAKEFIILLGASTEQRQCHLGQPTTVITNNGFMNNNGSTNIMRFCTSAIDLRTQLYQNIVMNQKYIADLHDPNPSHFRVNPLLPSLKI